MAFEKPIAKNMYNALYLSDILLYLGIKNSEEEMQYWLSHMGGTSIK